MKYTINISSGEYDWESDLKDPMEIVCEFLEKYEGKEKLAFGIIILLHKEGTKEGEDMILPTAMVLANIGQYEAASHIDSLVKSLRRRI